MTKVDWIFEDNLKPFLISIGWFIEYEFDEDDWIAIRYAIARTDQEKNHWFGYEFSGKFTAEFQLARDIGTSVVHVHVEVPPEIAPRVEAAIAIFQTFRLSDHA